MAGIFESVFGRPTALIEQEMQQEGANQRAGMAAGTAANALRENQRQFETQQAVIEDAARTWQGIVAATSGVDAAGMSVPNLQAALKQFMVSPQFMRLPAGHSQVLQSLQRDPSGTEAFTLSVNQDRFIPRSPDEAGPPDPGAPPGMRRVTGPRPPQEQPLPGLPEDLLNGLTAAQQREIQLSWQAGKPHETAKMAIEMRTSNEQNISRLNTLGRTSNLMLGDRPGRGLLDQALELAPSAGLGAATMARVPGSQQAILQSRLETIRANVGFDQLLEIKASGAGLGALDRAELEALQTTSGKLDVSLPASELRANLERIKAIYERIRENTRTDRAKYGGAAARATHASLTSEMVRLSGETPEALRTTGRPDLEVVGRRLLTRAGGSNTPQGRRVLEWLAMEQERIDRGQ